MPSGRGLFACFVAALCAAVACGGESTVRQLEPTDAGLDTDAADADTPDADSRDADEPFMSCASTTLGFGEYPAQFVFAVPRSAAMSAPLSSDDPRTRFEVTASALLSTFEQGLAARSNVGLVLSPHVDEVCSHVREVPSAPLDADGQFALLSKALADGPSVGSSSVAMELRAAIDQLAFVPNAEARVLVLFVDDEAALSSCAEGPELDDVLAEVRDLWEQGAARPYFVAAPGSGAGELVRAFAVQAGCEECWDDLTMEPEFAEGWLQRLVSLQTDDFTCSFVVPTPPGEDWLDFDEFIITATFDDGSTETLERGADCSGDAGFVVSEESRSFEFCPSTCERLITSLPGSLRVEIGCADRPR